MNSQPADCASTATIRPSGPGAVARRRSDRPARRYRRAFTAPCNRLQLHSARPGPPRQAVVPADGGESEAGTTAIRRPYIGEDARVRPFQFMIGTRGVLDRATLIRGAQTAESIGYSHLCIHDHLPAPAGADCRPHGRGHGDRAVAPLPTRVQQRPAPSGRPRPGAHDARRAERGSRRRRDRSRMERGRVRRPGDPLRPSRGPDRPDARGRRDPARVLRGRTVLVQRARTTRSPTWTATPNRSSNRIRRS